MRKGYKNFVCPRPLGDSLLRKLLPTGSSVVSLLKILYNNKMFKILKNFNVVGKRVLVRCDFNVPLTITGEIADDFRIAQSLPTIKYLIDAKAKIILMSHLDPENTKIVSLKFNLNKVAERLSEYLKMPVAKADDCIGPEVESKSNLLQAGDILLLENLRFHKEETEGDLDFARKLSYLGDIYVNDAFSVCHRNHASISGILQYMTSCMGLLMEKEIENLNKILFNPQKPMIALIGGKKVETKAAVIEKISGIAGFVIISGLIKKEAIEKNIQFSHSEKIIGPADNLASLDIDEKTVEMFCKKIRQAKTILWNGPFGRFEDKNYEKGTLALAEAIIETDVFSVVGGGETIEFLNKKGIIKKFSWVSTGGGAMLSYLAGEKLPGLQALENF